MEIKTKGTIVTDVVVNITPKEALDVLLNYYGVPFNKHYENHEIYYSIKEKDGKKYINERTVYYRNCGRGEEKYDYETNEIFSDNENDINIFCALQCLKKNIKT